MAEQSDDRWINSQLRRVPLPAGLLERLRAIAEETDDELDACLRDVAVPVGLLGRLKEVVADDELDLQIADVPVPAGLLGRLTGIPDDEGLDQAIRGVPQPLPARLERKLARIPRRTLLWNRMWHLATAASLLLTISLSYFLTMFGLIADAYRPPEDSVIRIGWGEPQIKLVASPADVAVKLDVPEIAPVPAPEEEPEPVVDLIAMHSADRAWLADQWFAPLRGRYGPLADVHLIGQRPLGSPHRADDDLPELQTVPPPRPGGLAPPLDRGYDRGFLLRHGVNPIVVPAADGHLANPSVPLSAATDSYDHAERSVAQRRLPDSGEVRVEDFLNAIDYHFPLPEAGQVGIRTAAGPSVFGERGARLLQVGVQAGRAARRATSSTYVTLAVDVSDSMRWDGRLDDVRRALRRFVGQLEAGDRLSLVRFHEEAFLDKEYKGPEQADELLAAIDWLRPGGGTNIGAGLQLAASVAMRHPAESNQLVLVSDGVSGLPETSVAEIERFLGEVGSEGVQLTVIDLSRGAGEDPLLARWAAAADGAILKVASADAIHWTLVEALTESSSLVADDVVLNVQFNPDVVAAYRLLGHAPAVAGLMPQGAETSLRSRQAATALFEVWLKPDGGDEVAVAEARWRDPDSGSSRQVRQRISRLQFAPAFAEAPLSLQAATVAAEAAEVLGGSYFVGNKTRGLEDVLLVAREVHPRLAERPSYQRFVDFLQQAERVQTQSGATER